MEQIAFLGFGEAAPVFSAGLRLAGCRVTAYDILIDDPLKVEQMQEKAIEAGVKLAKNTADAVRGADIVISTVTAGEALTAARQAAPSLHSGQLYIDLNSVSPVRKQDVARCVETAGAHFIEAVAMDTVPVCGWQVPILVCGPHAALYLDDLKALGLNIENVGLQLGQASSIKLLRSVLIKGFEALFAEAVTAAAVLGVEERVVHSLDNTFPGVDWQKTAGYLLSRLSIHGQRRSEEMRQAAALVKSLGLQPLLAEAIAARQQWAADHVTGQYRPADASHPSLEDFIRSLPDHR